MGRRSERARWPRALGAIVAVALLVLLVGCSDDGESSSGDDGTTTTAPETETSAEPTGDALEILVTNDDGVGAEGIDQLVQALVALPDVEVTVVAPAENQSGSSDTTTPSTVPVEDTSTAGGYPAVAVAGSPADSVVYALDVLGVEPDVVVSGANSVQNLGSLVDLSGTIGAARVAARRGIPALAVSQGAGEPPDYQAAVDVAVDWVEGNREALSSGDAHVTVVSINAPSCTSGEVRDLVEVPLSTEADLSVGVACDAAVEEPTDDVQAFLNGYATATDVGLGD